MKEYSESLSGKAAEVKEIVPIHLKMTLYHQRGRRV